MKVSLNPLYQNNCTNFSGSKEYEAARAQSKQNKIITAKTKKVISECATVAAGLAIVYFAMKHNLKVNGIKTTAKKAAEMSRVPAPYWEITPESLDLLKL